MPIPQRVNGSRALAFAASRNMEKQAMADEKPKGTGRQPLQKEATRLDEAHREAGDGTLQGSVPAGLTADELRERARDENPGADAATD